MKCQQGRIMSDSVLIFKTGTIVTLDENPNLFKVLAYDALASLPFGSPYYSLLRIGSNGQCIDSYSVELMTKHKTTAAIISPKSQRDESN